MTDLSGIPTPCMDWDSSNLPEAWKKFTCHVNLIFQGPLKEKEEDVKVNYLLLWVGDRGRDIYNTWELTGDDRKKLKPHLDKFQQHVQPKLNPIFARYKFSNELQGTQSIEQYVTKLRLIVKDCNYTNANEMIRDRIVFGTNSVKVREKLIQEGQTLTLEKAISIAQSHEYSREQLKLMSGQPSTLSSTSDVHSLRTAAASGHRFQKRRHEGHRGGHGKAHGGRHSDSYSQCGNCGNRHNKSDICPAKGRKCNNCHKLNHFAKMCRSKHVNVNEITGNPQPEASLSHSPSPAPDPDLFIDSINESNGKLNVQQDKAFATCAIGPSSVPIKFKLDTGSQVNIIPLKEYQKLNIKKSLHRSDRTLSAYNGGSLRAVGFGTVKCQYRDITRDIEVYVIDTDSPPILGLGDCVAFEIIQFVYAVETVPNAIIEGGVPMNKESVLSDYGDIFKGIGNFPGECKIHVDPSVEPVVHPPRRVPVAVRDRLKAELDRMESLNIITKVTEPTNWVNSLVVVEKSSGNLRVCLDPQDLNKAIKRPHYPLRTLDDILPQLTNAKYFTKLDARSGYWAIKLDHESSLLTTFNTPYGRYRYLRLPFGLKSSQDEFQRKVDECLEGIQGVVTIVDDILVYGSTRLEHDLNLRRVLDRSRHKGIRFNVDKLEVGVTEVRYFGHLLTSSGLKPDPNKVSAIHDMKPPKNQGELETFLGLVNYLAKFAPNVSEVTAPLRQLLIKTNEFVWDTPQSQAFNRVKDIITKSPVLAYFDPQKQLTLQVDASKYGLGAALLQDGRPICYASKSLTFTEQNYANIEREMLGIVFGCHRFHEYVYGRKVTVETDHKPLEVIAKKPLHVAPPRLQRMLFSIQKYDLDIRYKPGKDIPVADTLSRNYSEDTTVNLSDKVELQVHFVLANVPVSDCRLHEIRTETQKDKMLSKLMEIIDEGWPHLRRQCHSSVIEFWNYRDELSVIDGIIFKADKIVIPLSMRSYMLNAIHSGHMGIERSIQRARDVLFWPKMTDDITNVVKQCAVCQENRNSPQKEPLICSDVPDYPWQVVATDLFYWDHKDYMVIVDYYSRYFEVYQLCNTLSSTVISKCKNAFSRHGIPEKVVSDNAMQYTSSEFTDFARTWNFTHVTSSPRYPQSNGLAERTVQTVKRLFTKSKLSGIDPLISLLEYRTTPLDIGSSPSQLLMGRRLRAALPVTVQHMVPEIPVNARDKMISSRMRAKKQYDKNAKPRKTPEVGESVRFQKFDKKWNPAVIVNKHNGRSFSLLDQNGTIYRRNTSHILPTAEKREQITEPEYRTLADNINSQSAPVSETVKSVSDPVKSPGPITMSNLPSQPYITRSGREVKPRIIPSM